MLKETLFLIEINQWLLPVVICHW